MGKSLSVPPSGVRFPAFVQTLYLSRLGGGGNCPFLPSTPSLKLASRTLRAMVRPVFLRVTLTTDKPPGFSTASGMFSTLTAIQARWLTIACLLAASNDFFEIGRAHV